MKRYLGGIKPRAHAIMHDLSDMQLEEASTAATEAYKILEQNGAADLMNKESKKKAQSDMNDDQLQAYLTYMRAIGYQSTAMNYRQSKNIKAVLAEVQPMVLIRPQDLDADPFLLNTPECAYDLRLGLAGAMPHSADHFVTKMTAVQPGEDGKALWQDALNLFFCGDKELIHYVQQVAGMIAVGKVFVEALILPMAMAATVNPPSGTPWPMCWHLQRQYLRRCSDRWLQAERASGTGGGQGKRMLTPPSWRRHSLNTSIVKQLCSTDDVSAEKKYKDPLPIRPAIPSCSIPITCPRWCQGCRNLATADRDSL